MGSGDWRRVRVYLYIMSSDALRCQVDAPIRAWSNVINVHYNYTSSFKDYGHNILGYSERVLK